MKKLTTLCGCIIALVVLATWAPNASATNTLYDNNCKGCHGAVRTCAGCHAHGVHPNSNKSTLNVSATPDSAIYRPGDTINVNVTGGYRPGWVRVQMWDRNCSAAGTCTQGNALVSESLFTSGTEVYFPGPVTLTAPAPNTPGDYTWYAGWYGNEYDVNNPAIGLWISDSTNENHGNELVAFSFTVAPAPEANCSDGIDNDGDGLVDCNDQDCQSDPVCQLPTFETNCADGVDNDGDGFVDCTDSDCDADPICQPPPVENCTDGVDNDGDGYVDCDDVDCDADPICQPTPPPPQQEANCGDGIDNDGDGAVDCDDADCQQDPVCQLPTFETDCADGVDNDGDGYVDCDDIDCDADPICQPTPPPPQPEANCGDGTDNDGDGAVDCADSDCNADPICQPPVEDCTDGVDNDSDGFIDCADQDCADDPICQPVTVVEDCTDGVDNDEDGFIDCADPDCAADPLCSPPEACPQFVPPANHIILEGEDDCRALHARGLHEPFSNGCTACHGTELTGPASGGFAPSCYTCHGVQWEGEHDGSDYHYDYDDDNHRRSRRWNRRSDSDSDDHEEEHYYSVRSLERDSDDD